MARGACRIFLNGAAFPVPSHSNLADMVHGLDHIKDLDDITHTEATSLSASPSFGC